MNKPSEYRRLQNRQNARTFRQKQAEKGLRQYVFWLTDAQVKQIRRLLGLL